jgi:hypothetical protein
MSYFGRKSREARELTDQAAWVGIEGGFAARRCTVLDMSTGGVRLRVDDPEFVQPNFRLKKSPSDGGRSCRIAWRNGKEIGVEFLPNLSPWP